MLGADTVTLHIPTEILAPLIVAAIGAGVTSYAWLIRKTIELSQIVKELQEVQKEITEKVSHL